MRLALFKKGQAAGLPAPVVGVLVNAAEAIKHGLDAARRLMALWRPAP
jgi:hypothetical protein